MHPYVDPRASDRAVGVELRILELGDHIRRVRSRPGAGRLLRELEERRRGMYDELAALAASATPATAGDTAVPVVRARRLG